MGRIHPPDRCSLIANPPAGPPSPVSGCHGVLASGSGPVVWSGPTMSQPPAFRAVPVTSPRGFRLEGEIDLSNASSLAELIEGSVEAGGDITLDLAGVAFMDSTAIQVLLRAGKAIEGRGRVILSQPGSLVSNVLKLIKADRLPGIEMVGTED